MKKIVQFFILVIFSSAETAVSFVLSRMNLSWSSSFPPPPPQITMNNRSEHVDYKALP
jgi:hypothetical protein